MKCGVLPQDFWNASLRDVVLQVDGFLYRTELVTQQQVSAAWMAANWQRAKRMPSLRSVLRKMGKAGARPTKKTVEAAKQEFKTLVDEMTGDLNIKKDDTHG